MEREKGRQDNKVTVTKTRVFSTTNDADGDDFTSSGVLRPFP